MWKKIKSLLSNTIFNIFLIFALAGAVLFFTLKDDGGKVLDIEICQYYRVDIDCFIDGF